MRKKVTLSESAKAMHEENFLSSGDGEDKKDRKMEVNKETEEAVNKKEKREEEKEENEIVSVKRRCVDFTSAGAFDILG